jgi:hypothetical protein
MKTVTKYTFVLAVIGLILIINGYSQPAPQPQDTVTLSGHGKKNADAFKESTDIAVAVFTSLGNRGADATGEDDYDQAEIEVVTILKGNLPGKLKVFYAVLSMPGKNQESPPVLGTQYIMFIQKLGPAEYEIKKLLPVTDDNATKVKALITAASATK